MIKLKKPQFIKIIDLQKGRSGYNIYVKVIQVKQRQVDTKDGQKVHMIDVIVADQTGSAKGFFKGQQTKQIKQGVVIAIRNGVKKIIKNHISLQLDLFGRITVQNIQISPNTQKNISDQQIKLQTHFYKKQGGRPSGRNQPYGRNQYYGRGGYRRNDRRDDKYQRDDRQDKYDRYGKDYDRPYGNRDRRDNRDNRYGRDNRDNRDNRYGKDDRYDRQGRDDRYDRQGRDDRYERDDRDDRDNRYRKDDNYKGYGRDDRDNRQRRDNRYNYDRGGDYRRNEKREDRKDNYDENKKRDDRDYDRRNKNYDDKNEKKVERDDFKKKPKNLFKINQIQPGKENFGLIAKVLSILDKSNSFIRCVLGDQTGTAKAYLSENDKIVVGKTIAIFGAEASVVDEHIEIQKGRIEAGRVPIEKINAQFDLSKTAWQAVY